jgi:uncharacterized surface anchored protein
LVVLKQATIRGRVFFLTDDAEETTAKNLTIKILDRKEDKTFYTTKTDKEGRFTLPNLDVGTYRLYAGRLILALEVKEPQDAPTTARRIPKTILIYMPVALRG